MKYIKKFNSINENIIHYSKNIPKQGSKVLFSFVVKSDEQDSHPGIAYIIFDSCDPITILGDFGNSDLPVAIRMRDGNYKLNDEIYTWADLKKGNIKY